MKFKVTITIQFSIRVKWWSRNLTFHDRFSRIFGKTQFPSSPKKGYFKTRIYRTTSIVHFSSMSKFLVNVNAWFAVPYCDGDWSGRRRKAKGEGGGVRGKSIEAPWKLEIDLCRCNLIASASNNLRLKTNGLNRATMSYTTSGPFIDTIPRYALIPLKLVLLVSKIGQVNWAERIYCYTARRPNNNSNFQAVDARWCWSASLIGLIRIENIFGVYFRSKLFLARSMWIL